MKRKRKQRAKVFALQKVVVSVKPRYFGNDSIVQVIESMLPPSWSRPLMRWVATASTAAVNFKAIPAIGCSFSKRGGTPIDSSS